ncbi:MAG TPA: exodeoxyribonuclease VII large subunit [Fibrobacter sp.]|nr:exodeoxyribonuclease VII large subunit [Fibrobacter sp.]
MSQETKSYPVSKYLTAVKNLIVEKIPPVWIHGVITQIAERGNMTYLNLAEFNEGDVKPVATLPLFIFKSDYSVLKKKLASLPQPFELKEQLKVNLLVEADFYIPYGKFQSRVLNIDPAYTLGELALTREAILKKLHAEGLLRKNRELPFPALPLHIGLITGEKTAAYQDFSTLLESSPYAFKVTEAFARMQGNETENTILEALGKLRLIDDIDVVCIIRGGGSKTDLNYFDSEALCRAIALYPRPVLTGIGHEIDQSLVDLVAWYACITPTACAKYLVERVEEAWIKVQDMALEIRSRLQAKLPREKERLHFIQETIFYKTAKLFIHEKEKLMRFQDTLKKMPPRYFKVEREILVRFQEGLKIGSWKIYNLEKTKFEVVSSKVKMSDPKTILKKGYSLTLNTEGQIIRHSKDITSGSKITTQFSDGTIESTVS